MSGANCTADLTTGVVDMYAFVVFLGLALGLTVIMQVLDELVPLKAPAALTRTVGVLIAAGLAWALDYSVFTAFGQSLREQWMHPIVTGLVLIGGGEFIRHLVGAIARRDGDAGTPATAGHVRAAA
ncbi:MAG TPA: hypothetical protein VNA30_04220 [Mycobacteriales bacterium]|nr:hypothetical protein [Mycobacteriales bacterium]